MSNFEAASIDHEYALDSGSADLTTPPAPFSATAEPAMPAVPSS